MESPLDICDNSVSIIPYIPPPKEMDMQE
jgi:hypothetical protein